MASHCYAMPFVLVNVPGMGMRWRPKYVPQLGITTWAVLPVYDESLAQKEACICAAVVTPAQETSLAGFNDVMATPLPANASTKLKNAANECLAIARQTVDFADIT